MPLFQVPTIFCDSILALTLAFNTVFYAHTKHIEIKYHFVHKKVVKKDLSIKFVASQDQLANILTKGLPSFKFLQF